MRKKKKDANFIDANRLEMLTVGNVKENVRDNNYFITAVLSIEDRGEH